MDHLRKRSPDYRRGVYRSFSRSRSRSWGRSGHSPTTRQRRYRYRKSEAKRRCSLSFSSSASRSEERYRARKSSSRSRSGKRATLSPPEKDHRHYSPRRKPSDDEFHDSRDRRRYDDYREVPVVRRVERQPEKPTKVVALRNVPLNVTENEIESTVRNAAISLGFSMPNLVRLLPQNIPDRTTVTSGGRFSLAADREPNTTSAFVDFPSMESAQVFVDACRRKFILREAKVRLELARLYVGSLSTMTTADSKLEWLCIWCQNINRPGCPLCLQCRSPRLADSPTVAPSQNTEDLGPNLPLPDMNDFIMDRKSGMLYNETVGLYFDPQTQQFISMSGIYYMKGISPENVLVPVSRMTAPGFTFQKSNQPLPTEFTLPWADSIRDEIATIDQASDTAASQNMDSSKSKASAVASVLAAAQYAVKQTKRTKTKTTSILEAEVGNEASGGHLSDGKQGASIDPTTQSVAQTLNVQSIFDDTAAEEEDNRPDVSDKNGAPENLTSTKSSQCPQATGALISTQESGDYTCFLCLRQFHTGQLLTTHELNSQLHKRNSEMQGMELRTN